MVVSASETLLTMRFPAEIISSCITCWLSYFTLVCLWGERTDGRSVGRWFFYFLSYGAKFARTWSTAVNKYFLTHVKDSSRLQVWKFIMPNSEKNVFSNIFFSFKHEFVRLQLIIWTVCNFSSHQILTTVILALVKTMEHVLTVWTVTLALAYLDLKERTAP